MCKTCEKETFFLRKVNAHSNLYEVEKKITKMRLICFFDSSIIANRVENKEWIRFLHLHENILLS